MKIPNNLIASFIPYLKTCVQADHNCSRDCAISDKNAQIQMAIARVQSGLRNFPCPLRHPLSELRYYLGFLALVA